MIATTIEQANKVRVDQAGGVRVEQASGVREHQGGAAVPENYREADASRSPRADASRSPENSLPPSERDFLVFEAVAFGGASTREAAVEFEISQTRVMQVRRHVAEWIARSVPDGLDLTPIQRLRLAAHIAEGRTDHLYGLALRAWRQSQKPATSACRGAPRSSHGDPRYLLVAARITERQLSLAGTARQVFHDAERDASSDKAPTKGRSVGREDAPPADASLLGSESVGGVTLPSDQGIGNHSPVGDCSLAAAESKADVVDDGDPVDANLVADERCHEMEARRQAFLAALEDDTAPVHPPFTDAGGMLLDSLEPAGGHSATASVRESEDEPAIVPLSRKELRKQRRIQARQQRKAK
jgi:hypothetical protein